MIADWRQTVDEDLEVILGEEARVEDPGRLREAMRYAVLGGGKRMRPLVVFGACMAAGGAWEKARPAAAAIELMHAYTLVHDDLPAMDNDELRRGKPTVHVAFGEASAILVGDALLTAAFGTLATLDTNPAEAVAVLARRGGVRELLAGQARDIAGVAPGNVTMLEIIHAGKTGALFAAAAELGAIAAGGEGAIRERLARFGMAYGIAFQHVDDRDDGDHAALGVEAAQRLEELGVEMAALLAPLGGRAAMLRQLAEPLTEPITLR